MLGTPLMLVLQVVYKWRRRTT